MLKPVNTCVDHDSHNANDYITVTDRYYTDNEFNDYISKHDVSIGNLSVFHLNMRSWQKIWQTY